MLEGIEFGDRDLLEQLVNGYLSRERTEKLLDRSQKPLLEAFQIERLVQFVCEEMWAQETRVLDTATIREIAELVAMDEHLNDETYDVLVERAPYLAFFKSAPGRDRVEFEHELFFAHFLGNTIAEAFGKEPAQLHSVLMRSTLPPGTADFAAVRIGSRGIPLDNVVEDSVAASEISTTRLPQVRENAAALVAAGLRFALERGKSPQAEGIEFRRLIFAGESFQGIELISCDFVEVEFRRTELVGARFLRCKSTNTLLQEVLIDPNSTRLELAGFDPLVQAHGLRVLTPDGYERIYRQDKVANLLYRCGIPGHMPADAISLNPGIVELMELLMTRFYRANVLWPSDDRNKSLISRPEWKELEQLLIEAEIITPEQRAHQGQPRQALRWNYLPEQVMAGMTPNAVVPEAVRTFWRTVRERYPIQQGNEP